MTSAGKKKHGVKGERVCVFVFRLELRSGQKEKFQSSDLLDVSTCLGLLGGQMWDGWTASEGGNRKDRTHEYRSKQRSSLTEAQECSCEERISLARVSEGEMEGEGGVKMEVDLL